MADSQYLYDIFNLHYESAQRASKRGDKAGAKRHLLYAAKMLLELAQNETGVLKQARLERANRLLETAENIETIGVGFYEGGATDASRPVTNGRGGMHKAAMQRFGRPRLYRTLSSATSLDWKA